jgi:hypothetical protein
LDEIEKERFRLRAAREGTSLAEWIRHAAREKLVVAEQSERIESLDDLRAFFGACAARETGREPDWDEHRRVIDRSIRSGLADDA